MRTVSFLFLSALFACAFVASASDVRSAEIDDSRRKLETPPKHKPHKAADHSSGSSSSSSTAASGSGSSSGTSGNGSGASGTSGNGSGASGTSGNVSGASGSSGNGSGASGSSVSAANGNDASGSGSSSGSGGLDINASNLDDTDPAGGPAGHRSILFVGVAAVAGVALAAAFVPKRKVEVTDHPLKGSLNKRINIFTHMAQHTKDPAARPPRRFEEEGATPYVNANEAMV